MSYHGNTSRIVDENPDFRVVLYTGQKSQLVVMTIPPGGEIGEETHEHVEQTLCFLSGTGEALLNDQTFPIEPGVTVMVTPGTRHNFKNTGTEPMKIVTVYAPPNHLDERIHHTKADADADTEDEAFGHHVA